MPALERGHFAGLAPSLLPQAGMERGWREFSSLFWLWKGRPYARWKRKTNADPVNMHIHREMRAPATWGCQQEAAVNPVLTRKKSLGGYEMGPEPWFMSMLDWLFF